MFGAPGSPGRPGAAPEHRHDLDDLGADAYVNALAFHEGAQFTIGDAGILARDDVPVRDLGSPCRFLLPAGPALLTGGRSGSVLNALSGKSIGYHRSPLACGAVFQRESALYAVIGTDSGDGLILRMGPDDHFAFEEALPLHASGVLGLAADTRHILSIDAEGAVRLTRIADLEVEWVRCCAQGGGAIACAAWDQGFVGVARERTLTIWRTDGDEASYRVPLPRPLTCVAVCRDSRVMAVGSRAGQVAFFDPDTRSWLMSARLPFRDVSSIAAVPSQPRVFTAAGRDGSIQTLRVR